MMSDPAYALLKRRSWLFMAPAVLGVLAVLLLVTWKQGLLTSTDRLYFMTDSAVGITQGMPVKLNGFKVGNVQAVQLLPPSTQSDRRVRVELSVYRHYMGYIPKTTKVRLLQEGLIGQSVIDLLPQRYDARPVASGELLGFERSRGIGEIAQGLEQRVVPILNNTDILTSGLADPKGNLQSLLKAGNSLAVDLAVTNQQVQATLAQTDRSMRSIEKGASESLATTNRLLSTVEKDLPPLLDTMQASAGNFRKSSEDMLVITGKSSQQIPRILDTAEASAAQSSEIIRDVRSIWPLRAIGRGRDAEALPLDSLEGLPVRAEDQQ